MPQQTKPSLEQLEKMEKMGFKMFGDLFKDTLTYVQIQREKKSYESDKLRREEK